MPELIYLAPHRLRIHPDNMRRYYPQDQVAEMAASIQANGGVIQALLIVPDPERPGGYLVVDGNMRLAGAQSLGPNCPPLKCEVIAADHAAQLLVMATTTLHYPKDPISEALHYRRLVADGYSIKQIAERTGIAWAKIRGRLRWLDLEPEIQEHVAAGRLPRDHRAAEALQSIPDAAARVKLAARLAAHRATIEAIQRACAKLVESLNAVAAAKAAAAVAPALAHSKITRAPVRARWNDVRAAARAACEFCDVRQENLAAVAEPAWEMLTHAAGDTCAACNLRAVRTFCDQCPLVEMLRRLADTPRPLAGAAGPLSLKPAVGGTNGRPRH